MPDRGTATVTLSGDGDKRTIEVELKGMPEPGGGVYELWLYNTLIGAQPLGTTDSGNGTITARSCPPTPRDFRFLDLSRESGADDHSTAASASAGPSLHLCSQRSRPTR